MTLTRDDLCDRLCTRDPRSPHYHDLWANESPEDIPAPQQNCSCHYCFYGLAPLADALLTYMDKEQKPLCPSPISQATNGRIQTHNDLTITAEGQVVQSLLRDVSGALLTAILGPPLPDTHEWRLRFSDGATATIYEPVPTWHPEQTAWYVAALPGDQRVVRRVRTLFS